MLKFPLLCSKLENTATLLLFGVLLSLSMPGMQAIAGEESAVQAPSAPNSPEPAAEKPAPASTAAEAAKPTAAEAVKAPPSDAKPANTKPEEAAAKQPARAASEARPNRARGGSAEPGAPQAAAPPPAPAKAEAKPSDAKPGNAAAAPKPAEPKEAAKPKDLTPKPDAAQSAAIRPSTVNGFYNIHFMGAHIGDFKIYSSITTRQYSLQASADISAFFGMVSWQGVTGSYGLMTANGPVPQNYTFRYATSDKREALEIRFQQRMVQDIIINPPSHPGSRAVPITSADLQNVVDPLSAVVLLAQGRSSRMSGGDACNKRLPIFDGRVRFDLVLSPKGTRSIGNAGKLHGTAYVCRVNYVPIAGHKAGKSGDYATGNSGIEIWLVPMPEAGLLVPYYVHVPTPAGTVSMVAAKIRCRDVCWPSRARRLNEGNQSRQFIGRAKADGPYSRPFSCAARATLLVPIAPMPPEHQTNRACDYIDGKSAYERSNANGYH